RSLKRLVTPATVKSSAIWLFTRDARQPNFVISLLPVNVPADPCLRCRVCHLRMRRLLRQLESMTLIFFTTFGAVFVAEIVGDKLLYTTGVLAARYRTTPIMLGMATAFMAKMGVAVIVGDAISHLPRPLVAAITAISFLGVAFVVWK